MGLKIVQQGASYKEELVFILDRDERNIRHKVKLFMIFQWRINPFKKATLETDVDIR